MRFITHGSSRPKYDSEDITGLLKVGFGFDVDHAAVINKPHQGSPVQDRAVFRVLPRVTGPSELATLSGMSDPVAPGVVAT
jgi:hypothetical protein